MELICQLTQSLLRFVLTLTNYKHRMCFQELSASLSSEAGRLYPLKCDMIRETDIKEAFQWIQSNLGGVDILVNNAGVASENSLMGEQP